MAKVLPYYTTLAEYPPSHKEVYHDHDDCLYGKEIKKGHRVSGTGNKLRCKVCTNLD